jgi:hypothetical protein
MASWEPPRASTGNVDKDGELVGVLLDRLPKRRSFGERLYSMRCAIADESTIDIDAHLASVAADVSRALGRPHA